MGKPKNTELNFLYMDEKYQSQENERKKKEKSKSKVKKNKKGAADYKSAQEDMRFNFDNEIVIGVTKIPDNKKSNNTNKNTKQTKVNKNSKRKNTTNKTNGKKNRKLEKTTSKTKKVNKKNVIIKAIVKWTILFSALIAAFIFFMMSPLFNLKNVQVVNNEKINADTIISLSELTIGENIYKTSAKQIEKNIRQNAYIESVKIQRKIPNQIVITVKERKATFMLEYANSYAYISNQGYILEISEEKLELPIIKGYITTQEEIKPGNRLNIEDLERLAVVLKIVESANGNEIGNLITQINIENKQNYTIVLESEKKTVYLGDASNLSNRMLYLKAILEEEKGIEGEVFINGDLNKTSVYFRSKE